MVSQAGAVMYLFRETADRSHEMDEAGALEEESQGGRGLFCRRCGYRITGEDNRITINGSHTHTFFNPTGILFELACFKNAPGCSVHGQASGHFSWFAGYQWRIVLCGQCATHLGWRFESLDATFFCLIIPHLTDGL
ncbi:MAG: cereblon family protein [Desulfoprunum sp.]|nr:cereblon family protein [Desulfoprunum sp.]